MKKRSTAVSGSPGIRTHNSASPGDPEDGDGSGANLVNPNQNNSIGDGPGDSGRLLGSGGDGDGQHLAVVNPLAKRRISSVSDRKPPSPTYPPHGRQFSITSVTRDGNNPMSSQSSMSSLRHEHVAARQEIAAQVEKSQKKRSRLSVRWLKVGTVPKLVMMLIIPFAAVAVMLGLLVVMYQAEYMDSLRLLRMGSVVEIVGHAVDAIHIEFAAGALLVPSSSETGPELLPFMDQFALTDQFLEELHQRLLTIRVYDISRETNAMLDVSRHQAAVLEDFRYGIQRRELTLAQIRDYYLELVELYLHVMENTIAIAEGDTNRLLQTMGNVIRLSQGIQMERLIGSLVLSTQSISTAQKLEWLGYVNAQTFYRQLIDDVAPQTLRDKFAEWTQGSVFREVSVLRTLCFKAFDDSPSSMPNVSGTAWWDGLTSAIDDLYAFHEEALMLAGDFSDESKAKTSAYLGGVSAVGACAFFVGILLAIAVGWSIRSPFQRMIGMKTILRNKLKEQDEMNEVITRFVPHDFLTLMGVKTLRDLNLGDCILKRATIMFSFIHNFQVLSERMAPHQNFQFINRYLHEAGPIIRQHHGFIDKFLGDGIMAIFADPNDATDAGLELTDTVHRLNSDDAVSSLKFKIGIGLHTGDVMMGTIGEEQRMDSTIISDTVNASSRMESLNKSYGSAILMSRDTFVLLNLEGLSYRYVGEVTVKGKLVPMQVFEVIDVSQDRKLQTLDMFNSALRLHESEEFDKAIQMYEQVLTINPADTVAKRRMGMAAKGLTIDNVMEK